MLLAGANSRAFPYRRTCTHNWLASFFLCCRVVFSKQFVHVKLQKPLQGVVIAINFDGFFHHFHKSKSKRCLNRSRSSAMENDAVSERSQVGQAKPGQQQRTETISCEVRFLVRKSKPLCSVHCTISARQFVRTLCSTLPHAWCTCNLEVIVLSSHCHRTMQVREYRCNGNAGESVRGSPYPCPRPYACRDEDLIDTMPSQKNHCCSVPVCTSHRRTSSKRENQHQRQQQLNLLAELISYHFIRLGLD